jgi:hypothetical protein
MCITTTSDPPTHPRATNHTLQVWLGKVSHDGTAGYLIYDGLTQSKSRSPMQKSAGYMPADSFIGQEIKKGAIT